MFAVAEKHARLICILLLLIMFFAGLLVTGDYGIPIDEYSEQMILLGNVKEATEILFGSESLFVYKFNEQNIPAISRSVEADHGIAAYYPFAILWQGYEVLSGDTVQGESLHVLWCAYTYVLCFTGVLCVFLLFKELFGSYWLALSMALAYFLSPRFFAEFHYNNKDLALLTLLIDSFCFAVLAARKNRWPYVLLFSLFAALMCNTKLVGLFFFGIQGLSYVAYVSIKRLWNRDRLIKTLTAAVIGFGLYYVFTPGMWRNPVWFFQWSISNMFDFSRWNWQLYFAGEVFVPGVNLPKTYLIRLIFLTTPLFVLLPAVFGFCVLVRDCVRRKMEDEAFFVLAGVVCSMLPLLVMCIAGSKVYNGWRHAYFAYMGVLLLSGFGLYHMIKHMARPTYAVLAMCLVYSCALIAVNHPYQYVYYNVFAGSDPGSRYELDYWGLSTHDAMVKAVELNGDKGRMVLRGNEYVDTISIMRTGDILTSEEAEIIFAPGAANKLPADYIIYNMSVWRDYGSQPIPEELVLEYSASAYGSEIFRVYSNPQHILTGYMQSD